MSKKKLCSNDTTQQIRDLKTRRVRRQLTPGKVAIHQAAQPTFAMWQELRREFHPGSLVKPEIAPVLLSHVPIRAVKTRDQWLLFDGFETYTCIQSLTSPKDRIRTEIIHYTNISRELVEILSMGLLMQKVESFSMCPKVGVEQIRRRLKTAFSQFARDNVLACDPVSQQRYSESLGTNISALKRQAKRLKPSCATDPDFITNIREDLRHEASD